MQSLGSPNPVTPTKPPGNDGAGHDNQDANRPVTQSNENAELGLKQKRQRIVVVYRVVKQWVTGDRAEQPEGNSERELIEHVLHLVHLA
jgi:hypothetical protein